MQFLPPYIRDLPFVSYRLCSNKARDRSDQSEDGTEIEDDDYLEHVAQHAILLVRLPGRGKRKTHDWLSKK